MLRQIFQQSRLFSNKNFITPEIIDDKQCLHLNFYVKYYNIRSTFSESRLSLVEPKD